MGYFKYICFFMLYGMLVITSQTKGETNGLILESLSSNRKTYYYGEPINLHYLLYSPTKRENESWSVVREGSARIELLSIGAPIIFSKAHEEDVCDCFSVTAWSPRADKQKTNHKQLKMLSYLLGGEFVPAMRVSDQYCPYMLNLYNTVLPVGRYQFRVTYTVQPLHPLLQVRQEIVSNHEFEVVQVPASEKDAFSSYKSALAYACVTHPAKGDGSYEVHHPKGLQRFIERYPTSRYAQYAMYLAADWIYGYMPGDKSAANLIDYFLLGEQLTLADLKVERAYRFDVFVRRMEDSVKQRNVIDKTLRNIQDLSPVLSEMVIDRAKRNYEFNDLKNYALEKQRQ